MIRNSVCIFHKIKNLLGSAIWCYQCVSTQPGCGTPFNWLWHWTKVCPENDDVCVKIIEEKDGIYTIYNIFKNFQPFLTITIRIKFLGNQVISRDCLSSMQGLRTDIPADHYEGCRPAAVDVKLANYVNNSIKELDIQR